MHVETGLEQTQEDKSKDLSLVISCPKVGEYSEAIPDHAYEISDQSVENPQAHNGAVSQSQSGAHKTLTQESAHSESMNVKPGTSKTTFVQCDENMPKQQCSKKNANDLFLQSSSESDVDVQLESEDEGAEDDSNAECVRCGENYNTTKKVEDWIKCINCKHWLHENCTNFKDLCQMCGIKKKK
ncbi:hypothetical protein QE152_g29070 [Popillia japonica]|uniref:Uncharacterized protein n=1 Tax=Popillia japonica TaxID=7064 RepID=A0AAW1JI07_POPJA